MSLLFLLQIRTNVVEEIELIKFEESSIKRRYKLEGGVASRPARIAMEEGVNLKQLQRTRKELGGCGWVRCGNIEGMAFMGRG